MKIRKKTALVLGLIAVCIGGWFQSPLTAEELGLDFWHLGLLEEQIARGEARNSEMDRADQAILHRISIRQKILENVIAQRVSVEDAAKGFWDLNKLEPASVNFLRTHHPRLSDSEIAIVQVVCQMRVCQLNGAQEGYNLLVCEVANNYPKLLSSVVY